MDNLFQLVPGLKLGADGTGAAQVMTGEGLTWANKVSKDGRDYWVAPNADTGGYDFYASDWKVGEQRIEFAKDGTFQNAYGMQKDNWKEAVVLFAAGAVGMSFLPGVTGAAEFGGSSVGVSGAVTSPVYGGSAVGSALPPASAAGSAGGVSWSTVGTGLSAAKTASGFLSGKATIDSAAARSSAAGGVPFAPVAAKPEIGRPQIIAVRAPQETSVQARQVEVVPVPQSSGAATEKESMGPLVLTIAAAILAAQFLGG